MSTYSCPNCSTALNVHGFLVLVAKNEAGRCGIVLLSDKLGNYEVHFNDQFQVEKGERTEFFCPSCSQSVLYNKDDQMVRLFYTDDNGEESTVIFSAVFGENATFQISEKRKQSYGEMISKFKDPEWYLND